MAVEVISRQGDQGRVMAAEEVKEEKGGEKEAGTLEAEGEELEEGADVAKVGRLLKVSSWTPLKTAVGTMGFTHACHCNPVTANERRGAVCLRRGFCAHRFVPLQAAASSLLPAEACCTVPSWGLASRRSCPLDCSWLDERYQLLLMAAAAA